MHRLSLQRWESAVVTSRDTFSIEICDNILYRDITRRLRFDSELSKFHTHTSYANFDRWPTMKFAHDGDGELESVNATEPAKVLWSCVSSGRRREAFTYAKIVTNLTQTILWSYIFVKRKIYCLIMQGWVMKVYHLREKVFPTVGLMIPICFPYAYAYSNNSLYFGVSVLLLLFEVWTRFALWSAREPWETAVGTCLFKLWLFGCKIVSFVCDYGSYCVSV